MIVGRAEQALERGQRRLGADLAAPALEAFQQGGLLAADIGAGADADLDVEDVVGLEQAAEQTVHPSRLHRAAHRADRVRIFGADVDETLGRAHREAGNRHALDQHEGIALHHHPVGEGAAVALVRIADDVFLGSHGAGGGAPLDPRREAGAAAAAEAGLDDLLDHCFGPDRDGPFQPFQPPMRPIVLDRLRIGDPAAGEGEPGLALQEGRVPPPVRHIWDDRPPG